MLESVVIQQSAEAVAQQNTSDKNEFGFGKTMKNTAIRTLRTVDESFRIMEEGAKDQFRSYFNRREERLAHFEQLDNFYSSKNLKKVLEIFYIKESVT